MQEVEVQRPKLFIRVAFIFIGIGSLLSWNAVISCFDFFIYFQQGYRPQVIFPNMNFILNLGLQLLLLKLPKITSYKNQIIFAFLVTGTILMMVPFVVIYLDAMKSFYVSCGLMLLSGLANAMSSSAVFGLVAYLPVDCVIAVGTGQGFAGIICNSLRYALLFFFSDSENDLKMSSYIFFGTAAFIIMIAISFIVGIYKDETFIGMIANANEITTKPTSDEQENLTDNAINSVNDIERNEPQEKTQEFSLLDLMKRLIDINILILLTYSVTFTFFPGTSIKPGLFGLSIGWKINTIIFIFNLSDTIGRNFVALCTPTKGLFYTLTIARLILIITFPAVCYVESRGLIDPLYLSIIVIMNTMVLAMTSGYCTSLAFALAPASVPDELKGRAGSSVSLSLITGIFLGTFFGIGMDRLTSL